MIRKSTPSGRDPMGGCRFCLGFRLDFPWISLGFALANKRGRCLREDHAQTSGDHAQTIREKRDDEIITLEAGLASL
jgi:hypothetical protein